MKENIIPHFVYILECSDGSYYTGRTTDLERRLHEHQSGSLSNAYTFSRHPVHLVWAGEFQDKLEAVHFEKQVKGWSRLKKGALIQEDWNGIHKIVFAERKTRESKKRISQK